MTEELGAISVGLRVGLGTLDRDLAHIKKKIEPIEREHVIPFTVGRVNVDEIKREIAKVTRGQVKIDIAVGLAPNAGAKLHRELQAQLKQAGAVTVQVKAALTPADVARLKKSIETEMKKGTAVAVPTKTTGGGGASSGGVSGAPPSRPVARSAPVTPKVASSSAAPVPAAPAPPPSPVAAPASAPPRSTRTAKPKATPAAPLDAGDAHGGSYDRPAGATVAARGGSPTGFQAPANFGGLPTGPSVGVTYRTDKAGTTTILPGPTRGLGKKFAKTAASQQARGVSLNTMRADTARPQAPETPKEIEYASRPTAVSLPLDEQAEFEQEKRGRGVRGASRSGARQRGERELTPDERAAMDAKQRRRSNEAFAARESEIRDPAHKSSAYFGPSSRYATGTFKRALSQVQFYRFDPVLGQAFEALQQGELGEARELLRGFSSKLAGQSPQQRKKFFRLFRNTEKVPPELLEKHAALQALFHEIALDGAKLRLANTEADVAKAKPPRGVKVSEMGVREYDAYQYALDQRKLAKEYLQLIMHGVRARAGGGRVGGSLSERLAAARARKDAYLVGETKPELFVGDSGRMEIVGEDGPEIRSFPESGQIKPHVPEWVRRMEKNAKEFTPRREPGGPVYGGRLAAEPGSGLRGRKVYREEFEGERAAIARGALSPTGGVQRVFVTNWPAGARTAAGLASAPVGGLRAAGPYSSSDRDTDRLVKGLGKELRDILGITTPVKPKEPTPETAKPGPITPEERVNARLESIFGASPRALRAELTGIRARLSETQSQSPVRSLAPAFGQITATFLGRGELLKRLAAARDLTAQATRAEGVYNAEVEKEIKLQKQLDAATDTDVRAKLTEDLGEQQKATKAAHEELGTLVKNADDAAKSADALRLKLGTLIGNTIGIVGGTLAFGATLGAAQLGLTAISEILGPVIERQTGYANVTARVTSALADQTRQLGGQAQAAVAGAAAQAGLSKATADTISPLLQQRAQTEAGNKALQEGLDLLHSYEQVRTQNAGRGGDRGLTSTTGGFFGSILNGVPSTSEQVANEFRNVPLNRPSPGAVVNGRTAAAQRVLDRAGVSDPSQLTGRDATAYARLNAGAKAAAAQIDTTADRLKFFNDAIQKGGEAFRFEAQFNLPNLDKSTREMAAKAADAAGAFDIASNIRDGKTILLDSFGKVVTSADGVTKALQAINTGLTAPDVDLLIKQQIERAIPAQKNVFAAQGVLSRIVGRGQAALSALAAPTPGTGGTGAGNVGGTLFEQGIVGIDSKGKFDQAAAAAAKSYKTQIGGAVEFVNNEIAQGRQDLVNLVPANLRTEFSGLLDDITATGKAISSIQLGIQQQQTNLQVAEYNEQLRIARRSLQDAKDLQAGIKGETRETLGGIEGQNIALQRQLQLLQFEQQQRSINFKLATAGFVAPGTTPEERAANIEFAKREAEFAQKQLDIQKQLAANQFKGVQITVDRNVTDLVNQINLLQQGRAVTIDTAAAARALDVLNKKQQILVERAGTYIEEGVKITQAAIDAAGQAQQATGKAFSYILGKTAEAWGIFGDQAKIVLQQLMGTAPKNYNPKEHYGGYASGIVGDTLGPTQITVGEAGGEKVAVLKNPKLVPSSALGYGGSGWGGGSGGAPLIQMTVVISGNTIREESDLEQLAEKVAAKTEQRLMTKTSLFGLRRA